MKQVWYHYTEWEDFKAGMYNEDKTNREERIQSALELLTFPEKLKRFMKEVVKQFPKATEQNFTNKSINHQAFLGQCACCIYANIHEDETREAWGRMTNQQRYEANAVADEVYNEWLTKYEREKAPYFQTSLFEKE